MQVKRNQGNTRKEAEEGGETGRKGISKDRRRKKFVEREKKEGKERAAEKWQIKKSKKIIIIVK